MESHKHPRSSSRIRERHGRGGILRDILTMGARPIACLDSLASASWTPRACATSVDGVCARHRRLRQLHRIPTVGGETSFHRSYNGNILVKRLRPRRHHARRIFKGTPAASAIDHLRRIEDRRDGNPRRNGGETNWLEGGPMLSVYLILAILSIFLPA